MARKLADKVAIITGASAGIGRASARVLAAEGCQLVVTARRAQRLDELAREVESSGVRAIAVAGDAREEQTAIRAAQAAVDAFGRVDFLINNAGIGIYRKLVETSVDDYDAMIDTNVRSTFLFTRHVVPIMQKQGSGTVLMVSSMAGVYGFAGEAVYCMTKFAQVGFAQALDRELREFGIKVGAICPGGVKTEFAIGTGRTEEGVRRSGMLDAEDVAAVVLMACTQSPGSRIIEVQMRPMVEGLA
jgi:NADP-dependent 3-hydroxy acid dehydrogenase YdfG